ncbi:MAG: amino acid ABC transporter permease [Eubacteriaceae bacterium]|nr:amino acid ABC transporter permease [Eubacteriaceae bacterium]
MTAAQVKALFEGTLVTLELTLISIAIGLVFALILALGRMSKNKILSGITWVYVWVFRGTPLMLQLIVAYFAIPLLSKSLTGNYLNLSMFGAAVLGLTLNTAAYLAEIFRAGIQSIDKGQMEAAKALGMTYGQAMMKIIIPQTYRRVIPPFANEFVMILKDTSLVIVIGLSELTRVSKQFAAGGEWKFYFIAGAIYLFLTTVFTVLFDKMEKKASKYE